MRGHKSKILRFALVGGAVSVAFLCSYLSLLAAGMAQWLANAVAFFLAVLLQYVGQAAFTFDKPLRDINQIARFAIMITLGYLVAALITGPLTTATGIADWVAATCVIVILPVQNFIFMALWVFAETRTQQGIAAMAHVYNDRFFDYINQSARASARPFVDLLFPKLRPQSLLDLGSGRGVWLDEWHRAGVLTLLGVDGAYVDRAQLVIKEECFLAADLTAPVDTGDRFDLAQSLEVGEHLPPEAAGVLVDSLTNASNRVLFSAAVKGQGGECHINEQPLAFWQALFEARGYHAYDYMRPRLKTNGKVAPWYRNNAILYINDPGRAGLPQDVLKSRLAAGEPVQDGGDLAWRVRRSLVSHLSRDTVTWIAQVRAAYLASRARKAKACGSSTS